MTTPTSASGTDATPGVMARNAVMHSAAAGATYAVGTKTRDWGVSYQAAHPNEGFGRIGSDAKAQRAAALDGARDDAAKAARKEHLKGAKKSDAKKIDARIADRSSDPNFDDAARQKIRDKIKGKSAKKADELAKAAGAEARKKAQVSATTKAIAKFGQRAGLRAASLGAMAVPGVGWVMAAATVAELGLDAGAWLRSHNNPAYDAEPEPPRTTFLPLTHNGNRDPDIERFDKALIGFNQATFNFDVPGHRMWHPNEPGIESAPDLTKLNEVFSKIAGNLTDLARRAQGAYSIDERVVHTGSVRVPELLNGLVGHDLKDRLTTLAAAVGEYRNGAQELYQTLRDANSTDRNEIANSGTGINPFSFNSQFWSDNINAGKMANGIDGKRGRDGVERLRDAATKIGSALDDWNTTPVAEHPGGKLASDATPLGKVKSPLTPGSPPPALGPVTPPVVPGGATPPGEVKDKSKDPEDALREAVKQMAEKNHQQPGMQMPSMPSMPGGGMGGMPNLGNLGGLGPRPAAEAPVTPMRERSNAEDMADLMAKRDAPKAAMATPSGKPAAKGDEDEDGKDGGKDGEAMPGGPTDTGLGLPTNQMDTPAPSNVVHLNGRDVEFDSPKHARVASLLSEASPGSPKSLEAAMSEAGLPVPPPGQNIGEVVAPADLRAGDVIKNADGHGFVYTGNDKVIDEYGQERAIDEVANFDGPNQGAFRILDTAAGGPMTAPADTGPTAMPGGSASTINPTPGMDPSQVDGL